MNEPKTFTHYFGAGKTEYIERSAYDKLALEVESLKSEVEQLKNKLLATDEFWQSSHSEIVDDALGKTEEIKRLETVRDDLTKALDGAHRIQFTLKAENESLKLAADKLADTLSKIANEDYRGNRPQSSVDAFNALAEWQKMWSSK